RGMVVGVERQELAISEVLANIAWAEEKSFDGMGDLDGAGDLADHPLTEWNDAGSGSGELNDFLFIELAYTGPGELNFADNPATSVQGDPGENFRIVVRNPRDTWQYREDANGLMDTDLQARAIIPRAGSLSAARPYFTIASANDQYVPGMTFNAADARSRMRVNFKQTLSVVNGGGSDVASNNWYTVAPQPYAANGRQVDNDPVTGAVLRDTTFDNDAQILDTLVTGPDATNDTDPTFWMQHLNDDLTTTLRASPDLAEQNDLFRRSDPTIQPNNVAVTPVVEVLLQTRLNPLRAPKASDPLADPTAFADQERDNPWITVDRTRALTTRLDLYEDHDNAGGSPPSGEFVNHFQVGPAAGPVTDAGGTNVSPKVASRLRMEPLLRASELAGVGRTGTEFSLMDTNDRLITGGYGPVVFNSIGGHDRNNPGGRGAPQPFFLWQPHFDRAFAGPADLIGVPLYDPETLTGLTAPNDRAFGSGTSAVKRAAFQELGGTLTTQETRQIGLGFDPSPQAATPGGQGQNPILNDFNVAGSRLLYPDVARTSWQNAFATGAGAATRDQNSWYRLLQYVGTPRRTAEMVNAPAETVQIGPTARLGTDGSFDVGAMRRAGLINLNTLRHPHVLAGLLDDPRVHRNPSPFSSSLLVRNPGLSPAAVGLGAAVDNDLYQALLISRDGRDPIVTPGVWGNGSSQAVLPGLAHRGLAAGGGVNGNPFTGYHAPTDSLGGTPAQAAASLRNALQATPLRLRPQADPWIGTGAVALNDQEERGEALPRAFFGVGSENVNLAETAEAGANPGDLDFTTRYRLLNKVLNSATHRSNVFLCFMQVDFFHARELTGAELNLTGADARQRLVRIGAQRGDSPRYRGVFLIDRSQVPALLRADHLPTTGAAGENTYSFARDALSGGARFPWQDLIIHRQRIQ
ncbi:MAG: hypothetical protein AAF907_00970, partial [Planctomycetota bacterium]